LTLAALFTLFTIVLGTAPAAGDGGPFRDVTFDQALAAAATEGKVVVVDFYTTWCPPCKALDSKTWPDPAVRQWIGEKAVAIKVDAEKETALAARYRIAAYPTILIAKADGTEIDRIVGFRDATALLAEAGDALAGRDSVSRAKAALAVEGANNPGARMRYADALATKGRYDEALAEYLWCFDHGLEHDEAFVGVRASFLVGAIARLGNNHPPALDALRDRRNAADVALKTKEATRMLAGDLVALNGALEEHDRTLATFDALVKRGDAGAEARATIMVFALDRFLEARRYDDVLASVGDPIAAFDRRAKEMRAALDQLKTESPEMAQEIGDYFAEAARELGAQYHEALVGAGRADEAAKLADRVIANDTSGATYALLMIGADRAGKPDLARALAARGLKQLPKEEQAPILDAQRRGFGEP
jgi:thiol-disulfide isomerase/thioredoxin